MANLYDLMDGYEALQRAMDDEDVLPDQLDGLLDQMEESRDALRVKVDNICRLLRNTETEIDRFRSEEKRLAARRKSREAKKERVRAWLKTSMDLLDVESIKTDLFDVAIVTQGERIVVVDEERLPEGYVRVKRSPDMTKLNRAYKSDGEIAPGCDVVVQKALRIR